MTSNGIPSSHTPVVLLAEDEEVTRKFLRTQIERFDVRIEEAQDGEEAIGLLKERDYEAAIFDLEMPGAGGIECLEYAHECQPGLAVVIVSAVGEVLDAVAAMKLGALDYLTKPCDASTLQATVMRAIRATHLARENDELRGAIEAPRIPVSFVAEAEATRALVSQLDRVADLDTTVLLTGPSGSGKTLLAKRLHDLSRRADRPFVSVNCAALPRDLIEAELFGHARGSFTGATHDRPGRVEVADGGTLFLDEIGDLPIELQPKLLTFLQERECQRVGSNETRKIDVRVVAATNQDLMTRCREGLFREDLYYRLDVISLPVPPLAERRQDIPPLCDSILRRISQARRTSRYTLESTAAAAIEAADWPGNVRQLENCLERATAFCQDRTIAVRDLRLEGGATASPLLPTNLTLEELEVEAIRNTLASTGGNQAEAARRLGVSEKTIYNKIKRYAQLSEIVNR